MVSGALVYNAGVNSGGSDQAADTRSALPSSPSARNIRPIDASDHIKGNPNAPIKIVEFSDLECPFCARFHPTMTRLIEEYDGQVAWVYRHFPLDSIHSKARKEAEASECAAELGGNTAFWAYVDRLFEVTPSNNNLDLNLLPEIAKYIGLSEADFQTCLDSGKYAEHIEADLQDAVTSGGRGTPYSVMVVNGGEQYVPINGALPYETVKLLVDQVLSGL